MMMKSVVSYYTKACNFESLIDVGCSKYSFIPDVLYEMAKRKELMIAFHFRKNHLITDANHIIRNRNEIF